MKKIIGTVTGIVVLMVMLVMLFTTSNPNLTGEYYIKNIVYLSGLSSMDLSVYEDEYVGLDISIGDSFIINNNVVYQSYTLEKASAESLSDLKLDIGTIDSIYNMVEQGASTIEYSLFEIDGNIYLVEYYNGGLVKSVVTLD